MVSPPPPPPRSGRYCSITATPCSSCGVLRRTSTRPGRTACPCRAPAADVAGPLAADRVAALEQPAPQQRAEVPAGDALGEGDELIRLRRPVAMLRRPGPKDVEEGGSADPLPQCLQRHPAAQVDRLGE